MENLKQKKLLKYEEIRELALADNSKADKVSVGIWARLKGYKKIRKTLNKKTTIYYYEGNTNRSDRNQEDF